jgi:hypothetical protein
MKCRECDYQRCWDDDCDACEELDMTGLCIGCHKEENCVYCGKLLKLDSDDFIQNVMYEYFCDVECYARRKNDERCKR